jgi:hypothetical protein
MNPSTLALVGNFKALRPLAEALSDSEISLLIQKKCPPSIHADLILQVIENDSSEMTCNLPWLAWDLTGKPQMITRAYQAGARAVFPAETPVATIAKTIQRTLDELGRGSAPDPQIRQRKYQRGEIILLEMDTVLLIKEGVLATTMIYHDGAEALLGLSGADQIVVAHPADNCHIQIVSHTNSLVEIQPWESATQQPDFQQKLRARLQQMEGWAAMQARPSLPQRILGILGLLAGQFGSEHEHGALINVRITHAQLASAVGATRTSVTRVLGELRDSGKIMILSAQGEDHFCLCEKSLTEDHQRG